MILHNGVGIKLVDLKIGNYEKDICIIIYSFNNNFSGN